ncbi:MAG: hypothetical protein LBB79_01100 [Prevotellaceae bacterium]|jgi:hypothetical protein|nr:hypothetical protein [Prevotellaceae bacterium]
MSHLQKKSEDLVKAANLLHGAGLFPAVAHSAYYCCVQLMKHIWLHSMKKTEMDLRERNKHSDKGRALGTHEFLISNIATFIYAKSTADFRTFSNDIGKLKKLRVNADYYDETFNEKQSSETLRISNKILPILKKY